MRQSIRPTRGPLPRPRRRNRRRTGARTQASTAEGEAERGAGADAEAVLGLSPKIATHGGRMPHGGVPPPAHP